ncbi:MAG TPA: hypothetical protein VHE55_06905 [Fimbriimonadaceae bacterium]|nr:hypothetical protein [Fimbriimonadaceae bacterium]
MKRLFPFLAILGIVALSWGEARLTITMRGHPAGYATLSQRIQRDGTKVVELRIELGSDQHKVKLSSEARYDAKGIPIRKFQQTIADVGDINKQVIATFSKEGANLVLLDGGKRSVKNVSLAQAAPRACLSEFWFIRDKPKPGAVEETYQFNTDTLAWEIVRTEYRGVRKLTIEGHTVSVHEVSTKRGDKESTSYLDDEGLPVLVDQGDIKMVKIWPK